MLREGDVSMVETRRRFLEYSVGSSPEPACGKIALNFLDESSAKDRKRSMLELTVYLLRYDVGILLVSFAEVARGLGLAERTLRMFFFGEQTTALTESELPLYRNSFGDFVVFLQVRFALIVRTGVLDPQDDHDDDRDDYQGSHDADHDTQHRCKFDVVPRSLCNFRSIR